MKRNDIGQVVYEDVEGNSHVVEVVVGTRSARRTVTIRIDLDTPWISIDISQMIDADRPIAEAIAANYLNENFVKKNSSNPKGEKRIIMIDECHKMFPYEHLRLFLARPVQDGEEKDSYLRGYALRHFMISMVLPKLRQYWNRPRSCSC